MEVVPDQEVQQEEGTGISYDLALAYQSLEDNIAWGDFYTVIENLKVQVDQILYGARDEKDLYRAQGMMEITNGLLGRVEFAKKVREETRVVPAT